MLKGIEGAKYELSLRLIQDRIEESNHLKGFQYLTELYSNPEIQYNEDILILGICYEYGIGVEINQQEAFRLYLDSYEGGYLEGAYLVGKCYEEGIGIKSDLQEAQRLYNVAINQGNIDAINRLKEYDEDKRRIRMTFRQKYEFE